MTRTDSNNQITSTVNYLGILGNVPDTASPNQDLLPIR
jgi:hypothetical protein